MSWTRSIDLVHWADTVEARTQLPLLIRRLVQRTVPSLQKLNFPAGEQVQRPGFDGEVWATEGNQFVPSGHSGWEMGVDKNPKGKADEDFEKRTLEVASQEQNQTTFVFVTPRVWLQEKREEWIKEKAAKSSWRSIIALDANDLEHWLEFARGVAVWFSRFTGRIPTGVQDLESYWVALRSIAEHPLVPSVFTESREEEIASVRKWLSGSPSSLFMRTNGLSEGVDFLAALGSVEDQGKLENGAIVYSAEAWRDLSAVSTRLY